MENTEGPPKTTGDEVLSLGQHLKKAAQKGWGAYRRLFVDDKIPAEEINEQTVAQTIVGTLWAGYMRFGDKTEKPISPADILANMGHGVVLNTADYRQKHPNEYAALRHSLDSLVQSGVLERVPLQKPDVNHESIYYKVTDKETLRQLAENPQTGLPTKP